MALHDSYRQDKEVAYLTVEGDVEVECKYLDLRSPEYNKIFTKLTTPYKKLIEAKALPPVKDREIAIKAFVQCCVRGWRTVIGRDDVGEPSKYRQEIEVKKGEWVPYSETEAIRLFMAYPKFYTEVFDAARELPNFQLSEEEGKNSLTV